MWCPCETVDDDEIVDEDDEINDEDEVQYDGGENPDGLSYVGDAAYKVLHSALHRLQQGDSWNLTHGRVVGEVSQTPNATYWGSDQITPLYEHDDQFPDKMYEILVKAQRWVDITSLSPPDGKFLTRFNQALIQLARNAENTGQDPITVRMLFGNIIGMPVDTDSLLECLMDGVPEDAKLMVWVGSWRKGVSWNHSKIIAVDGYHLFTGGHNLWDGHYLQTDPVHDISMEAEGQVANDGHTFANYMWKFIKQTWQQRCITEHVPKWIPMLIHSRVCLSHWPPEGPEYPPLYHPDSHPLPIDQAVQQGDIPMITMGRYGALHHFAMSANPSDKAIIAMFNSAKTIIKMSLQDLGPLTLPISSSRPMAIPGGRWPDEYLGALAIAIYDRGVDVEIVLSNPASTPGGFNPMFACYGNGWSCNDVASEIIKAIQRERPAAEDKELRTMVEENLRVTYLRSSKRAGTDWPDGQHIGNHCKFFIIDDVGYYIGSQNLYISDLAEWGVFIDNKDQTKKILDEYWDPMWQESFTGTDYDIETVMHGLSIDRNGADENNVSPVTRGLMLQAMRKDHKIDDYSDHHELDHDELTRHFNISLDQTRGLQIGVEARTLSQMSE
mmetsp:Transcript_78072/g.154723  ORF Transcript_78072/g.154723 Transcript_78072/m.154723 type:complete len:611 (+) Transcript_78072:89-1921(+)